MHKGFWKFRNIGTKNWWWMFIRHILKCRFRFKIAEGYNIELSNFEEYHQQCLLQCSTVLEFTDQTRLILEKLLNWIIIREYCNIPQGNSAYNIFPSSIRKLFKKNLKKLYGISAVTFLFKNIFRSIRSWRGYEWLQKVLPVKISDDCYVFCFHKRFTVTLC